MERPAPELVARFDTWLPQDERVERRKMFGCPCAFVNGNMFTGVYEQGVIARVPPAQRERLLAERRAEPFTVNGRTMREYVAVQSALARDEAQLVALIADALAYTSTLPTKAAKARKPPGKARPG